MSDINVFSGDVYLRETENGNKLLRQCQQSLTQLAAHRPLNLARIPHRRFPNYLHDQMQMPDQSCPFDADASAPFLTGRHSGKYRASRVSRVWMMDGYGLSHWLYCFRREQRQFFFTNYV